MAGFGRFPRSARYLLTGTPSRRQDSTTERIAAAFGPAFTLPTCSQFFLPRAIGRIELSARLLDKLHFLVLKAAFQFLPHIQCVGCGLAYCTLR